MIDYEAEAIAEALAESIFEEGHSARSIRWIKEALKNILELCN